jgi:hypothetical protein
LVGPKFLTDHTWRSWRVFLAAFFGIGVEAFTDEDWDLYEHCTGRTELGEPQDEAWLVVGRRGGKSRFLANIAVFLATTIDWSPYLAPGEKGYIPIIAPDRKQAKAIMGYASAPFLNDPILKPFLVKPPNTEEIELADNIVIEVATCSYKTIRSRTVIAALCDECAFWPQEDSTSPDTEVLAALRPCMATIPGAKLLGSSSPYARRGVLWENYRNYWGDPDAPLLWKATTREMHPGITQEFIDKEIAKDPERYTAEYMAEFRHDIIAFVSREVVDAVVVKGRFELAPRYGNQYFGFVDPSGGSSDSMTLAIAHKDAESGRAVLDLVREVQPPFKPDRTVAEFCGVCVAFGISNLKGDAYGGDFVQDEFEKRGIMYEVCERFKREIYLEFLPLLNSGRVEYLDNQRLIVQTCGLERHTARGGRDLIDHAPGSHDDVVNVAAGALLEADASVSSMGIPAEARARAKIPARRAHG